MKRQKLLETPENIMPLCPTTVTKADQYITIPVAEYIYLHKQATMLEMIIKDKTYNRETVATAKALWLSMNDLDEAGAEK